VSCSSHSLNLVVNQAVKVSFEITNFFGIVQDFLEKHIISLKLLSNTR
jgi:hypothetical protein